MRALGIYERPGNAVGIAGGRGEGLGRAGAAEAYHTLFPLEGVSKNQKVR